ncbi:hypothetical protein ES703_15818 [subsurface metagenome]
MMFGESVIVLQYAEAINLAGLILMIGVVLGVWAGMFLERKRRKS